jgi:hypothetical protein
MVLSERYEELPIYRLKIDECNVSTYEETSDALRIDLEELVKRIRRYPVICEFGEGYRVVFRSREDIEGLIQLLQSKISEFRAA